MTKTRKKGKLYYTLQAFSSVPLLILGLIIMMFGLKTVRNAMYGQVHTREFDTLKFQKVPQCLEIGLFFCQIFIFTI